MNCTACLASAAELPTPSFFFMFSLCDSTVRGEMPSFAAISRVARPIPISW